MSSNDRYRGNREYRDLTVQTHYKTSGRSARVQTKGSSMNDLSFSQNSVDARRPYEDTAFIERSRQKQRAGQQPQTRNHQNVNPPPYTRDPYPQGYQQRRQHAQGSRQTGVDNTNPYGYNKPSSAKNDMRPSPASDADAKKQAAKAAKEAAIQANSKPKVSKEVALQIEMIFKIGIMLWGAAALVTIIVLLTGA